MLLPLLLSTSAALYRGAIKAAREAEVRGEAKAGVGAVVMDTLGALPKGMWAGIGLVWLYWTATQLGLL